MLYQKLLESAPHRACEKNQKYQYVTERHVQALWLEQKYLKAFPHIEVVHPGLWNVEPGPDFRKAHLRIQGKDVFGDIEIHLYDEDWVRHGHHLDPRYDNVVLHISLWKPKLNPPILTSQQAPILQVYLENFLTIPLAKIPHLIDIDLYPYRKFNGTGKCAEGVFKQLPQADASKFFVEAARWRLSQKKVYLKTHTADPLCIAGASIATALGYKNNGEAFLDLFSWLLDYRDLPESLLLALAMGVCGFFETHFVDKWKPSPYYQELKSLWWGMASQANHQAKLHLHQIRPLNHPIRRLVYLTKFLADPRLEMLGDNIDSYWIVWDRKNPKQLREALLSLIPEYEDPYWNHHYTFENDAKETFLSLMGADLKYEILVNGFLPILQEKVNERGVKEEMGAFQSFYQSFPSSKSSKKEYLVHRFFGETSNADLMKKRVVEQGAFQLHKDFCVHFEASCEGCPFVDRFKTHFNTLN